MTATVPAERCPLPTVEPAPLTTKTLLEQPYVAYAYSYPHKSAYGPLSPPVPLESLWQAERRQSLFLYVHVPFCEMRCGFCNLFTSAQADAEVVTAYLDVLERQARVMSAATEGDRQIARLAFGGGTPTYLSAEQLDRLLRMLDRHFGAHPSHVPTSIETSPKTASLDRLRVLREHGIHRVSIGIQSFLDAEAHAMGRPQDAGEVVSALERIHRLDFPIWNVDLIYGHPSQTVGSWLTSIRKALTFCPHEVFLYPLYIRPQTGLARRGQMSQVRDTLHRTCYREGRDLLLAAGFRQVSMRCFRLANIDEPAAPAYCCQADNMLGLGCGARTYTARLHYSSRFAVDRAGVQDILRNWLCQDERQLGHATWGIWVTDEERQRRFIIQSLLTCEGLNEKHFRAHFGVGVMERYPQLAYLVDLELATHEAGNLRLTANGLELSDAIGPWLYSPACRQSLEKFTTP